MNDDWIDEKLNLLSIKFGGFKKDSTRFFFEPTEEIYGHLESGDEDDLHFVVAKIAEHLEIPSVPIVHYDWGLKMEPNVAGQIQNIYQLRVIRIPFFYVGKRYALGSIIAHEMSHAFLFHRGLILNELNENEMFTDLTAVFVGLGKLMLNGKIILSGDSISYEELGYLKLEHLLYSYKNVCGSRNISLATATKNLVPEIVSKINDLSK
jgi:hypothetical protein